MLTMAGLEVESLTSAARAGERSRRLAVRNRGDAQSRRLPRHRRHRPRSCRADRCRVENAAGDAAEQERLRISTNASRLAIEDPDLCPRYSARIVDEVAIAPSPAWLRFRLEACGIRAINNVVDVTNYVMLETGQPLHAFDLDRLPSKKHRRQAGARNEEIYNTGRRGARTGARRFADLRRRSPVALAGVMGGIEIPK